MEKITTVKLQTSKSKHQKIAMLTAYDYPFARILDEAGVDIVLVGDSLGNVAMGYRNTLPVTMEEMVVHTRAVVQGVKRALVVADMPFGSFQENDEKAVGNAITLVKAGAEAVKIEGVEYISAIRKIIKAGIPVMGHIGFTPQAVNKRGPGTRGKETAERKRLLQEAKALEKAGCFAVVLEMVEAKLAQTLSKTLKIPMIGIGSGPHCDGQVLVTQDLLGLSDWQPSFARPKVNLRTVVSRVIRQFIGEGCPCSSVDRAAVS
ncbi:MAG: 3-methyl-2-oxobutanoate hydroxymethyltransferase [Candidatus Margulisiibacteriota bacterium]